MSERSGHWDKVYQTHPSQAVSWYRSSPDLSIDLLLAAGLKSDSCVVDVGAGDSTLIDVLLARGLSCLAVLDVSEAALERSRTRAGEAGRAVRWIHADVTSDDWTMEPVDLWHDRAVFHFLVDAVDRQRYVERLHRHVRPGGGVIIATFAAGGPERCSGLPVQRYDASQLQAVLGSAFTLVEERADVHMTPAGGAQQFLWARFTRVAEE